MQTFALAQIPFVRQCFSSKQIPNEKQPSDWRLKVRIGTSTAKLPLPSILCLKNQDAVKVWSIRALILAPYSIRTFIAELALPLEASKVIHFKIARTECKSEMSVSVASISTLRSEVMQTYDYINSSAFKNSQAHLESSQLNDCTVQFIRSSNWPDKVVWRKLMQD